MTSLRRHLAQRTAGNLGTAHAQFVRRRDALLLNETHPPTRRFKLGAVTPREIHYAAVTYRANSFRIQTKKSKLAYLRYAAPGQIFVDLPHSVYKIGDSLMSFLLIFFFLLLMAAISDFFFSVLRHYGGHIGHLDHWHF